MLVHGKGGLQQLLVLGTAVIFELQEGSKPAVIADEILIWKNRILLGVAILVWKNKQTLVAACEGKFDVAMMI